MYVCACMQNPDTFLHLSPAAAASTKKTPVTKTDLFGEDNEEDDLFSSISSPKPAATPAKQSEAPPDEDKLSSKGKEKKVGL